jgi:2-phospho-L-lactate transferase/gluconeogenesis factor (CofD/UPF0052 family)
MTINVVVFSGGRGVRHVHEALAGVDCSITFLINGYDSGLSTGEIRLAFEGMLGPSDFRKTFSTSLLNSNRDHLDLAQLLEDRMILGECSVGSNLVDYRLLLQKVSNRYPTISIKQFDVFVELLDFFLESGPVSSQQLRLTDMPFGNALFVGAFLASDRNFNSALESLQQSLPLDSHIEVLNISDGADLWLAGLAGEHLVVNEGGLVSSPPPSPIDDLFLIERKTALKYWSSHSDWALATEGALLDVRESHRFPDISPSARNALDSADLIIYGNGTQHSSIFPSLLTNEINQLLVNNRHCAKVLLVNGSRDNDFHISEGPLDLVSKLYKYVRTDSHKIEFSSFVTHIIMAGSSWDHQLALEQTRDTSIGCLARVTVLDHDRISPSDIYSSLNLLLKQVIGRELSPVSRTISIIVPVLNEAHLLNDFLLSLKSVQTPSGFQHEVICVDGGSKDGSEVILRNCPWISFVDSEVSGGRASSINTAVRIARGEYVCVFHADLEYSIQDLNKLIGIGCSSTNDVVIGSRTHNSLSAHNLRLSHEDSNSRYWISRVGGVLAAALLSIRLGRVISDPFCGLLMTRKDTFMKHFPKDGDLDAQITFLMSANASNLGIVEVGIGYSPRSRRDGKKSNARHGLSAIRTLLMPRKHKAVM